MAGEGGLDLSLLHGATKLPDGGLAEKEWTRGPVFCYGGWRAPSSGIPISSVLTKKDVLGNVTSASLQKARCLCVMPL